MSFRRVVAWFGVGVTALCAAFDASCATLTVSTTNDAGTGSLRQLIKSAAAGDNINIRVTGLITLTNGELLIDHDLIIVGPGATNLALSGNHLGRIFRIAPNAIVSISDLTIRDGHAADGTNAPNPAGQNGGDGQHGGGVYNVGTLRLFRCAIEGNLAGNGGCGGVGGTGGNGGGIYNAGTLTIEACTFSGRRMRRRDFQCGHFDNHREHLERELCRRRREWRIPGRLWRQWRPWRRSVQRRHIESAFVHNCRQSDRQRRLRCERRAISERR